MKLKPNVTVYHGGKKYKGEAPDHLVDAPKPESEKKTEQKGK